MIFHKIFADNTNPNSIASRLRRRRFRLVIRITAELPSPVTVLDVGGTVDYWRMMPQAGLDRLHITLLNLAASKVDAPNMRSLEGDARDLSQFADNSFDVVFSNSVIEHLGRESDQYRMAREVRRVGRFICIQTPNRYFPIEPHFQFPLFQFLPVPVRVWMVRRFNLGWSGKIPDPQQARQYVESIRLLTGRQFAGLFPETVIHREKFLGMTKSFVAFTSPSRLLVANSGQRGTIRRDRKQAIQGDGLHFLALCLGKT